MKNRKHSKLTQRVHAGSVRDVLHKRTLIVSSSAYGYPESTVVLPARTSYVKMNLAERKAIDITDDQARLPVGVQKAKDLTNK